MADQKDYTVEEFAREKSLHPVTVRRLLRAGELPGYKIGPREWRIPADAWEEYVKRRMGGVKPPKKAAPPKKQRGKAGG
ncbi:MAG: helix-turn-helix domain-containing protein [Bryobacteraceae bacterium]